MDKDKHKINMKHSKIKHSNSPVQDDYQDKVVDKVKSLKTRAGKSAKHSGKQDFNEISITYSKHKKTLNQNKDNSSKEDRSKNKEEVNSNNIGKLKHDKNDNKEAAENKTEKIAAVIPVVEDDTWAENTTLKGINKKNKLTNDSKKSNKSKSKKWWKILIVVLVILLCTGSIAGAAFYSYLNSSFDNDDEDTIKAKEQLTETDENEPFYMVVVGTDTRNEQQEAGAKKTYSLAGGRSDTCMLVRVDPKNYAISILSIPRDTQIMINGNVEKFNAAYNYGGIAGTIEQVKKLCKVDIAHYAEISFNGLIDLVDAIGGVEVDVPTAINDPNSGVPVPQGKNVLNGEQALSFSRSRAFADGDFTRSSDQRILIEALINKGYNISVADIPNLVRAAKNFIHTDMKISDGIKFANHFKNGEKITLYSSMVPSTTGTEGGVSYCYADYEALSRQMAMMDNGEDINLVEITSDAAVCSSRDEQERQQKMQEYYAANPNSKGKATNTNSSNSYQNETYNNNYSNQTKTYNQKKKSSY